MGLIWGGEVLVVAIPGSSAKSRGFSEKLKKTMFLRSSN
jgi:hypothetical protein